MARSRFDVLGLGCTAVDELLFVEGYPAADAKVRVLKRERHCGGLTATALVAAARLGAKCAYAGVLGQDEDSRFVLDTLRREGVDVRHVRRRPAARPVRSVIVVDIQRGTRAVFYDTDGVIGADAKHPPAALIAASRVLLVDRFGIDGMIRAARIARAHKVPVVADLESTQRRRCAELLKLVDHLIISQELCQSMTGADHPALAVSQLQGTGYPYAIVTAGADGCWFQARGWLLPRHHPAFKVQAVDTTGCGDVFHGAYAFALAREMPLVDRIRLASATAALKATKPGGQAGIPTLPAVRRLLRRVGGLSGAG